MTRPRHKTRYPSVMYRERANGTRVYIVAFSDANGDSHTKTLHPGATLEDARLLQGQLQARKAQGETLTRSNKTVAEMLDEWLEARRSSLAETTVQNHEWAIEKHLKPEFGRRKLSALSPSDVARLISELKSAGMKTWSVKKILAPLSGAYQVAVREGWVSTSPLTKLLPHERPKGDQREMRCLSRDEIGKLLEATDSERWKTLFALLVSTGLRIGEALALTWDDVDFEDEVVRVRKSKTKAGEREVLMIGSLRCLLSAHKLRQVPGVNFVFATSYGTPCERRHALRALHAAEKRANLPRYTLHELRHTFASILIGQGELPALVAKQMGHADPGITMKTYVKLWDAQASVEQARERLQETMEGVL